MSRILLPFKKNPLFASSRYTSAVYFSIIEAQGKDIMPWVAGEMVNYQYVPGDGWQFDTLKNMYWYDNIKLFYKQTYLFDSHIPGWKYADVFELAIRALEDHKYIHTRLNAYYLPEDAAYQSFHRTVNCLIYGYDDVKKEIYYLRFLPGDGITECCSSFNVVTEALCCKEDGQVQLELLRFNPDFEFKLNINELYNGIFDFLNSTQRNLSIVKVTPNEFGIESLKRLRNYLIQVGSNYEYIERNYYTSFYDFQVAMDIRYRYLRQCGILPSDWYDTDIFEFKNTADQFLFNCEKYNKSKEKTLLKDIVRQFDQLVEWDIGFSSEMFDF